jgi:hypothetical protein
MRKKLEGNGLWESSRMMLPEHHRSIQQANRELDPKPQPELDEQEMEKIGDALYRSWEERLPIKLYWYDPYEEPMVEGVVEQVDAMRWRIRVDGCWFDLRRLIRLEWP